MTATAVATGVVHGLDPSIKLLTTFQKKMVYLFFIMSCSVQFFFGRSILFIAF